jgi:ABC-type transport system substrate-binding protein
MKTANFWHLIKRCVLGIMVVTIVLSLAACGTTGGSTTPNASSSTIPSASSSANEQSPNPSTEPSSNSEERPQGGEVVNVVSGFNGFFAPKSQTTAMDVCWPALESLGYQTSDGVWHPRLATSWDIDNSAYTVTLHIREGVKFHNGDTFDAKDVAWTLNARNDYKTASNIGNPASIEATDDYTVVVTYNNFSLDYLNWLLPQFMYSKETFDEKGEEYMMNNIIGTGPYAMS